jgi:hypothetical protein
MTDIYLVTKGEYSDYHIVAAFSTEAEAVAFAALIQGDVESQTLDPAFPNPGVPRYLVLMEAVTGKVVRCKEIEALNEATRELYRSPVYILMSWHLSGEAQPQGRIEVWCYARSPEHAIHIANDLRATIQAQDYWRFLRQTQRQSMDDTEIQACLAAEAQHLLEREEGTEHA